MPSIRSRSDLITLLGFINHSFLSIVRLALIACNLSGLPLDHLESRFKSDFSIPVETPILKQF
jgi:hypothetical protein